MIVEQMMSKTVVTVELDDSLKAVKEIFDNVSFHHLLVIDHGKLCGVISDRDLLKAISPNVGAISETYKDKATLDKKVHQIMTRNPTTLFSASGIYDAIDIFNSHAISCIPVVDKENVPVGILSWRDILKVIGANHNKSSGKK